MSHIPTPYQAVGGWLGTQEDDPQTIGYMDDHRNRRSWTTAERYNTAKYLAKACNIHADLISALRLASGFIRDITPFLHDHLDAAEAVQAVIAEQLKKAET